MNVCALGLTLLPSGAAWWAEESTLILADLHLEKGSSRAARGVWLPPYDTQRTLDRIRALIDAHKPQRLLCLGDGFEDRHAWIRMESQDQSALEELTQRCDWTWIAGNHDPTPPAPGLGTFVPSVEIGGMIFQHQPGRVEGPRVFAHFHPKATLVLRGRRISGRCFLATERDLLLPSFGTYTGGLDRHDPAIQAVLRGKTRTWLLHQERIFPTA